MITKSLLTKVYRVCQKVSFKTGVDVEDLFSECQNKIPNVLKNYNPKTGKELEPYLLFSMRGYCLNYCRDKSFLSGIGRTNILIFNQSKKFPNLQLASECMMIPLEKLEEIHLNVSNLRRYNSVDVSVEWKLDDDSHYYDSYDRVDYLRKILNEEEFNDLYQYIFDGGELTPLAARALNKVMEHKDELSEAY